VRALSGCSLSGLIFLSAPVIQSFPVAPGGLRITEALKGVRALSGCLLSGLIFLSAPVIQTLFLRKEGGFLFVSAKRAHF